MKTNRCSPSEWFASDQLWFKVRLHTGEFPDTTDVGISVYDTVRDAIRTGVYYSIRSALYEITT